VPLNSDTLEKRARQVLGVASDADTRTIKRAYHRLVRQYHPDCRPDDSRAIAKFLLITEAYEYLLHHKIPERNSHLAGAGGEESEDPQEQYARWWQEHFREFF